MSEAVIQTTRFSLFAVGFSERTLGILKMVLERYPLPGYEFVFAPMGNVQILIVNGDLPNVAGPVGRIRRERPCPAVLLGTQARSDIPEAEFLSNPLSPRVFLETLKRLADRIQSKTCLLAANKAANSASEHKAPIAVLPAAGEHRPAPPNPMPRVDKPVEKPVETRPPVQAAVAPRLNKTHIPEPPPLFRHRPAPEKRRFDQVTAPLKKVIAAGPSGVTQAASQIEHDLGKVDNRGGRDLNVDFSDSEQALKVYLNLDRFLSAYVRQGIRDIAGESGVVEVLINGRSLALDMINNRWSGDFDLQSLQALCLGALNAPPEVRRLDELPGGKQSHDLQAQANRVETQRPTLSTRAQRAEFIVAQIGLWCSRGYLPAGTDLNKPLHLRYWPNLPQLPRIFGAVRVAALWIHSPCSLIDTMARAGCRKRDVFAFYIICDTLGLFEESDSGAAVQTDVPASIEEPIRNVVTAAPRGFLRRLLGKVLTGGGEEANSSKFPSDFP